MKTAIYLIGEPGVGKTTISLELAAKYQTQPPTRLHKQLWGQELTKGHITKGVLLGKPKPPFSGTDTLGMSVTPDATEWAKNPPYRLIIAEGARLANERFLTQLAQTTNLHIIYLTADNAHQRRQQRQNQHQTPPQNPTWIQGRKTAARNLAARLLNTTHVQTIDTTTLSPCTIATMIQESTNP